MDIREYYEDSGNLKPGKKGISLQVEQWEALKEIWGEIDDAVADLE
ncbi:transcriptional coactivator p15/PC4 family protein [Salmonella sp. s54925]